MIASTIIDYIYQDDNDKEIPPYIYFDGVLRVSKFILDMYLYVMFCKLYIYFFRLKKELRK